MFFTGGVKSEASCAVIPRILSLCWFLGRKPEEEDGEDNGLEENSRDGQVQREGEV